jgi:cytochrome c-type biogenesis protein CcmH/NrfG
MRRFLALLLLLSACDAADAKHRAAGNLHFKERRYAEAKAEFEQAVKRRPDDAGNHILLANARFELEDYDGARRSFEEALRLDPDAPEAHRGLAIVVMRARPGDRAAWNQARAHLEKVLARNPKDRNAIVSVAQIVSENADRADAEGYPAAQRDAEELLRRALALDDRDPRTLFHLALVYARKGDLPTALQVADRLERVVKERPGFPHYTRAIVYTIAEEDEQALASLARLLEVEHTDPDQIRKDLWLAPLSRAPGFAPLLDAARARPAGP